MKDLVLGVYLQRFSFATSPSSFTISLYFVTHNSVQLVARPKHDCRLDPMIFGSRFRRALLSSEKRCEPILLFCFLLHFTLRLFVDRDFAALNDDGLYITRLNKMDALDWGQKKKDFWTVVLGQSRNVTASWPRMLWSSTSMQEVVRLRSILDFVDRLVQCLG